MKKELTLPVGRLVQGDAFVPSVTDQQGNPRVFKSGPNIGKPNPQYFIAIAYAKTDTSFQQVYASMQEVARASFPQLFDAAGNCVLATFSWKLVDGDGYDTSGKPNNVKDGFAGHWVLRLSSGFAPKVYIKGKYDPTQVITDPRELPRGYYVRALIDIAGNDNAQKPGLYMNLKLIEIDKPGPIISNGPDASAAFAATASPGAYTGAPVMGNPPPVQMAHLGAMQPGQVMGSSVPPHLAMQVGQPMTPQAIAPVVAAPIMVAPAPHMVGVVQPMVQTIAPPPQMVIAPPPVMRQMTAAAQGPYEAYIAAGYNDAMLVQMGLMVG